MPLTNRSSGRAKSRAPLSSNVLSERVCGRQSQQGGPDRLHAETADHPECDAHTSDSLASGSGSACVIVKTVAVPIANRATGTGFNNWFLPETKTTSVDSRPSIPPILTPARAGRLVLGPWGWVSGRIRPCRRIALSGCRSPSSHR